MLTRIQILKIRLMEEGVHVPEEVREVVRGLLTLADYPSTSGVTMALEEDVWVNAPIVDFNPNFLKEDPPHRLVYEDSRFFVESDGERYESKILPVPSYHDTKTKSGEPYTWLAITHSDRVRISPIGGCAIACKFCDIPYVAKYRTKSIDDLVESVQVALDDSALPAQHILISGGTPKPDDYEWQNEVYETVADAFPGVDVDVMMVSMPGLLDPQHLKDVGIHGLSINIEMWNQETARKIMASKVKAGRQLYFDFIEEAVDVFGADGKVRSLILVGIEPIEDTLQGVEALAQIGCDPVLSPFRPDPATPMKDHPPPSVETLVEVYERSLEIVERYGVKLGPRCIPCHHNTLTFVDDPDGYYYS